MVSKHWNDNTIGKIFIIKLYVDIYLKCLTATLRLINNSPETFRIINPVFKLKKFHTSNKHRI